MEAATPAFIQYKYGEVLMIHTRSQVHTATCLQSALQEKQELLHTHRIPISSCLVIDSSPVADEILWITSPKHLGNLQSLN